MSIQPWVVCRLDMTTLKNPWTTRILIALPVLFLLADSLGKILQPAAVTKAMIETEISPALSLPLGLLLATCVALYLIRRTAPLGAVLLTGYLGGAVLAHARLGDPLLTHTLFPIYVGAFLWAGLLLRDARVRRLLAA